MAFVEKDFKNPTRHNIELHSKLLEILKAMPKGHVLDLPSGPGYLVRDLKAMGFTGIAGEIDESLHCFSDLEYKQTDMTKAFPFADHCFDYVTSVEGIEHIDNHFAFIKEVSRVLKPGGRLLLTTPNIHSLRSRLLFFLSGFHLLASKPIPLDTENIYFEHINPIGFNQLYFYCAKAGLEVETLTCQRMRGWSKLIFLLSFPLIYFAAYRACYLYEKNQARRAANRPLFKFLISKANLIGAETIVIARKK